MSRKGAGIKFALFVSTSLGALACVHHRTWSTQYLPAGRSGGYSEHKVDEQTMVATFAGNAYTSKDRAELFSRFRAQEYCSENGFKIARIFGAYDRSTSKDVQHSSSNTYYNPYFGNYMATSHGNSWTETLVYPTVDTYFRCTNEVYAAQLYLKPLSADDTKEFVKDRMGSVQVQDLVDSSANKSVLKRGDIILRVDGERTQTIPQAIAFIDGAKDKNSISVDLVRDGKPMKLKLKAINQTELAVKDRQETIADGCQIISAEHSSLCSNEALTANAE